MITYRQGDITQVKSGVIVHGCNCQGVMGSGVAKALRNMHPEIFTPYSDKCKAYNDAYCLVETDDLLGQVVLVEVAPTLMIANAITQKYYGNDGRKYVSYDAVDAALDVVGKFVRATKQQIHMPKIGAGLGGGDWRIISSIVETRLSDRDVTVWSI